MRPRLTALPLYGLPLYGLLLCSLAISACDGDGDLDAGTTDGGDGMDAQVVSRDAGTGRDTGPDATTSDGALPDGAVDDGATLDGAPSDGAVDDAGPRIVSCDPLLGVECDGDWTGRCSAPCAVGECCSPQGGRFECAPRDLDGNCPAADIWVDESQIEGRYTFEWRFFDGASCSVEEACVSGTGWRRLLLFDTWTPNTGTADLYLGPPADMPELYEYSPCHDHNHFNSYARYELLDLAGGVAATGHKQAFCLLDFYRYPGETTVGNRYTCDNQGIQVGYQDVYGSNLDCQWVDVTGVAPGDYELGIEINYEGILLESDYSNNTASVPVTIPSEDITVPCAASAEGAGRDCGWTMGAAVTCTPGRAVQIGCSERCGLGSCTGDPALRVCEPSAGTSCTGPAIVDANDDQSCGGGRCGGGGGGGCCPRVEVTCPAGGQLVPFTAPYRESAAATCTLASMEL